MHELLSSHPNQVPIAVTTALTPLGPTTVFHQPPSDSEDDDDVYASSRNVDLALPLVIQGRRTTAQPSTRLRAASKVSNGASSTGSRLLVHV
ncbi:unnamed protein product, partial [Rhizoctonia solani]